MNVEPHDRGSEVWCRPLDALVDGPPFSTPGLREIVLPLLCCVWVGMLCAGCSTPASDNWASYDYAAIYNNPLLSPGAQFAAAPPAVQNTIRAETGSTGIWSINKDTSGDLTFYRIDFVNRGLPPLFVSSDGSVLDPNLNVLVKAPAEKVSQATGAPVSTLMLSQLPPAVVRSIQLRASDAEVASIDKETHGDQTTYFITFKDNKHPALHLAADGTPLQ